jgi:hypothetical protein
MIGLILGGLGAFAGYELYKKWRAKSVSYSLTSGNNVSVQLDYTGTPPAGPIAAADLQTYLNAGSGQGGQLMSVVGNPSLDATNKIISYVATYSGPTGTVAPGVLGGASGNTNVFPPAWGTVTVGSVNDVGTTAAPTANKSDAVQQSLTSLF